MVQTVQYYESTGFDPYYNIATEKYLMDHVQPCCCSLYLWQNKNTVVIGRNQNAWTECRTELLECEGGFLARRLSGGGAVFHDLGNLNFTFIMCKEDYDLDRQFAVIQNACAKAGIEVVRSGRNDLLANGCKFSGNAFYHSNGHAYHHGTLLVNANMEKLSRYLTPSKAKLQAKGVQSVRSRVVNLQALAPELSIDALKQYLICAFSEVYGKPAVPIRLPEAAIQHITASAAELGSWEWLYGRRLPFSFSCSNRFVWGEIEIQLQVESGLIQSAQIYSDSMDWRLSDDLTQALTGCRFSSNDMQNAIQTKIADVQIVDDLTELIESQNL